MNEHWAIYDVASGDFIYGGGGPPGSAADQVKVGDGRAAAFVPAGALLPFNKLDLDAVKQTVINQVDAGAETFRHAFITPGAGQALTYQYKAEEARRYGDGTPTPFLTEEAKALGVTEQSLADEVNAQVAAWTVVGARIEALRRCTNRAVREATNLGGVLTAARIDWEAVLSPPAPELPEEGQ